MISRFKAILQRRLSPGCFVDEYRIVKKLAEGKYGVCYLTEHNGERYILKLLKQRINRKRFGRGNYEANILAVLNHPSIPQIFKLVTIGDMRGFALQYIEGMTLEQLVFKQKCKYSRTEIYEIGKKLIDIISYLHGQGIVHRDIRIPNIIINDNDLYLVDFGLANYIDGNRYKPDVDFSYLGDTLLYLYYSSFEKKKSISRPWYKELNLTENEFRFLKKLMGLKSRYSSIIDIKRDFNDICKANNQYERVT